MNSALFQKHRPTGKIIRLSLLLAGLILLVIGCIAALSMILVDRDSTSLDKVVFISGMLLGFLLGIGFVARARR